MNSPAPFPPCFETSIAVVGVGLIGGSIAAAIKRRNLAGKVVGVGRHPHRLEAARAAGLIDEAATSFDKLDASLVIFCTPVDQIVAGVREAAALATRPTLYTDAGSVKGTICRSLSSGLPSGCQFVGSHPLAGSEKQGFEHAEAQLFHGRVCVVTPTDPEPSEPFLRLKRFWESLGSTVVEMTPEAHDEAVAQTSHVPHVVAAALAATLDPRHRVLAASGFRDTTRVASGDPGLWTAILEANSEATSRGIDACIQNLTRYREAITRRDPAAIRLLLEEGKSSRDALPTNPRPPGALHKE